MLTILRSNKAKAYLCLLGCIALCNTTAMATGGIVSLTNEEVAKQKQELRTQQSAPVYVDQLIDENVAEDLPLDQLVDVPESQDDAGNLRSYVISTDLFHLRDSQSKEETRLQFNFDGYYQTLNYGDFRLEASSKRQSEHSDTSSRTEDFGSHFTLKQNDFALGESWTLENTLGVNQSSQSSLVSSSGQVNLRSQLYLGGMSRAYSSETELRFMSGEKGELSESGSFEGSGVKVNGLGISHYLTKDLIAGGQFWYIKPEIGAALSDGDAPTAENEYSAFLYYDAPTKQRKAKLQTMSVDGNTGAWLDGEFKINRFDHQFSFYHLADGLQWMGEELADDVQGASWRFAYRHPRFSTHSALSWQDRHDGWSASVQQGVSYQFNKEVWLGGNIGRSSSKGVNSERQQSRFRAYIARQFSSGQHQRLQLGVTDVDEAKDGSKQASTAYELDYTHQWLLAKSNDVGMQFVVRWNESDQSAEDNHSLRGGFSWRRELEDGNFGANINVGRSESGGDVSTDTAARLYAKYNISKKWGLTTNLEYKEEMETKESQVIAGVELSFWDTKGRPIKAWHRRAGSVRGLVFFDKNNDGIRQPLEKVAVGVTVGLNNNSIPQKSDRNGEFEFDRILPGTYRVGVAEESVPLPWELAESGFQSVEVTSRQTKFVYLPLVRLSELD